jgi:MFS family permease
MTANEVSTTALAPNPLGQSRWRIYSVFLLAQVSLTDAIWIIYLRDRGLSLTEVGFAEAAFHLAPLTMELPTGSLADVLGRKWSLALGAFMTVLSSALLWATTNIWMALPAMFLIGLSYTFRSGAEEAFLYDALAEQEQTSAFVKLFGRLRSASGLFVAAAAWAGAALAGISYAWPFAITIVLGLFRVWLAVGLREPVREKPEHHSIVRNIRDAIGIVRGRPLLAGLLAFTAIFWTYETLMGLYTQAVLSDLNIRTANIGLVVALGWAVSAAGGWFAHRFAGERRFVRWTIVVTFAMIGSGIALGSGAAPIAIAGALFAGFVAGLYEPIVSDRVNEGLPSAQRATIISVESLLFSSTMIWAFPLAGWSAERWGWQPMYAVSGAILLLALTLWLSHRRSLSLA